MAVLLHRIDGGLSITGISPVLLVSDVEESVAYYRDLLGFTCDIYGDPPDFVTAKRDDAMILLALTDKPELIVPNWRTLENMWNVYIRVSDADAAYAEIQERGG